MTSVEEIVQYLAKLIVTVARSERNVEKSRIELAEKESFVPFTFFRKLDKSGKGFLTPDDISRFLKSHNVNASSKELEHLFKIHSAAAERITYNDFLMQTLPQSDSLLKNQCLDRASRIQPNPSESEQIMLEEAVLDVYQKEIEFLRQVTKARIPFSAINDFNPIATFKYIDTNDRGYLDFSSLEQFTNRLQFSFSQEDFDALVRRIDKMRAGKITLLDYRTGLFPSQPGRLIHSNSYQNFSKDASNYHPYDQNEKPNLSSTFYNRSKKAPTHDYDLPYQNTNHRSDLKAPYENDYNLQQNSPYRPPSHIIDDYMQTEDQIDESEHKRLRSSARHPGREAGRNDALSYNNSKETLNLPAHLSARDLYTIDSEGNSGYPRNHDQNDHLTHDNPHRGRSAEQYRPAENIYQEEEPYRQDLNHVVSSGGFSTATYERRPVYNNTSAQKHFGSTVTIDPRRPQSVDTARRGLGGTMKGSPLHRRKEDPVYETYWGYDRQHNATVTASKPFSAYHFPYDIAKNTHHPQAYNLRSKIVPYYQPIRDQQLDVKRFKNNPFKYTDHEHFFKNYYHQLRDGYYENYFNMPVAQRSLHEHPDIENRQEIAELETPYTQRASRGFSPHDARLIPVTVLQKDPTYTVDKGYWPDKFSGRRTPYEQLSGIVNEHLDKKKHQILPRANSVRETFSNFQKPSRLNERHVNIQEDNDTNYDRRVDISQSGQKIPSQSSKHVYSVPDLRKKYAGLTEKSQSYNFAKENPKRNQEVEVPREDSVKDYNFENEEFKQIWNRKGEIRNEESPY